MKEFIEKLIARLEEEIEYSYCSAVHGNWRAGVENSTYHKVKDIVNQLAEEYEHCALCYLGSPCEYQNKNAILPNELLADGNGWIPCSERLPEDDTKRYIVQKTNGYIDILGFSKDAYRLSRHDFYECKGKKKAIFFDYDSEYGYYEVECEAWMPLPAPYTKNKVSEMPTGWKQNVMEKFERVD